VLAQEYLPARMGLATGLTVGLCGGVGGLIVAALGLLGDSAGPAAVLYVIAALPLFVAAVSVSLPGSSLESDVPPAACPRARGAMTLLAVVSGRALRAHRVALSWTIRGRRASV
jgi:hypothetical protein